MSDIFSPRELLKIAVAVEENGKSFYAALAKKAPAGPMRDLWNYLKDQEETHIKVFKDILAKTSVDSVYDFSPEENGDYLKALAAGYIFTNDLISKKIDHMFSSDIEAVDLAVNIEKDSILVYSAFKGQIFKDEKMALDEVLSQEKKHLIQLLLLKNTLTGGGRA